MAPIITDRRGESTSHWSDHQHQHQ
jgi:hypothetical protein